MLRPGGLTAAGLRAWLADLDAQRAALARLERPGNGRVLEVVERLAQELAEGRGGPAHRARIARGARMAPLGR